MCGALEFSEEISKSGTQPIIGTQINFIFNKVMGKIPIFAQTKKGFSTMVVSMNFKNKSIGSLLGSYDTSYQYPNSHYVEIQIFLFLIIKLTIFKSK